MFGKLTLVLIIIIFLMGGASLAYFKYSQSIIAGLHEDKAKLQAAVQTQEATISAMQDMSRRQNEATVSLQQRLADSDSNRRNLEAQLRRVNIETMARNNSADLERRINQATDRAFRDIVALTTPKDRPSPPQAPTAPAAQTTQPADAPQQTTQQDAARPTQPSGTPTSAPPVNMQPPPSPPVPNPAGVTRR